MKTLQWLLLFLISDLGVPLIILCGAVAYAWLFKGKTSLYSWNDVSRAKAFLAAEATIRRLKK